MNYGIENGAICEPVQVVMHLPENWTKILFLRTYGLGMADGGIYWDIPTETIPSRLRPIGSRFVIRTDAGKNQLSSKAGRESPASSIAIEELPELDRSLWPECKEIPSKKRANE